MQGMWSQKTSRCEYGTLCGFELQEEEDNCSPAYLSAEDEEFCIDGKRVAIVGSRDYSDLNEVIEFIGTLPSDVTIVSGGAKGVDEAAKRAAKKFRLKYQEWPAEWSRYGKQAGYLRNLQIVWNSDIIIAFWNGYSKGTKHTIDIANDRGVRTIVIKP